MTDVILVGAVAMLTIGGWAILRAWAPAANIENPDVRNIATDRNPSRPCGHIDPDSGWPVPIYCTRTKNHAGPHSSALKNTTWEAP